MPSDNDREESRRGYSWEDEEGWYVIPDALVNKIKADALREAAERDIAGEVWDLLVEHLPAKGLSAIYDKMRASFPAMPILANEPRAECVWTFDDSTDSWDSSCGEKWAFTADGPRENGVRYCHGCGKPVRIADDPETAEQAQKAADARAYKWRHDMMGDSYDSEQKQGTFDNPIDADEPTGENS